MKPKTKHKRKDHHLGDLIFYWILKSMAFATILILISLVFVLYKYSAPIFHSEGFSFIWKLDWNPRTQNFGAGIFIIGTLLTAGLALLISLPISLGSAIFIIEIAPKSLKKMLGFLIEMLSAIPSVVYGLWGIFIVVPLFQKYLEPFLIRYFGNFPLFQGEPLGIGVMSASLVLAIMITPTITTICRDIFSQVPKIHKEGALALGATRWEMIWITVIKSSVPGILGAIVLGLGRALGETMAVTMIIGNKNELVKSLFDPAQTMASLIVNEYAEATTEMHVAAITSIAMGLLVVSLIINSSIRFISWRFRKVYG